MWHHCLKAYVTCKAAIKLSPRGTSSHPLNAGMGPPPDWSGGSELELSFLFASMVSDLGPMGTGCPPKRVTVEVVGRVSSGLEFPPRNILADLLIFV